MPRSKLCKTPSWRYSAKELIRPRELQKQREPWLAPLDVVPEHSEKGKSLVEAITQVLEFDFEFNEKEEMEKQDFLQMDFHRHQFNLSVLWVLKRQSASISPELIDSLARQDYQHFELLQQRGLIIDSWLELCRACFFVDSSLKKKSKPIPFEYESAIELWAAVAIEEKAVAMWAAVALEEDRQQILACIDQTIAALKANKNPVTPKGRPHLFNLYELAIALKRGSCKDSPQLGQRRRMLRDRWKEHITAVREYRKWIRRPQLPNGMHLYWAKKSESEGGLYVVSAGARKKFFPHREKILSMK